MLIAQSQSNQLIDLLPLETQKTLLSACTAISLARNSILFEANATPDFVHLLTSGMAKIVVPMQDGEGVVCGLVGRDGPPEWVHILGPIPVPLRCVIEIDSFALRMRFELFEKLMLRDSSLRRHLLSFSQSQTQVMAQIVSCNALHGIVSRLARLLLMIADRCSSSKFFATHDCLARMLGTSRSSLAVIAHDLQAQGLISYSRGKVKLTDRSGLEALACECYFNIRLLHEGLNSTAEGSNALEGVMNFAPP